MRGGSGFGSAIAEEGLPGIPVFSSLGLLRKESISWDKISLLKAPPLGAGRFTVLDKSIIRGGQGDEKGFMACDFGGFFRRNSGKPICR